MSENRQRTQVSASMEGRKSDLEKVFAVLQAEGKSFWYVSVILERRHERRTQVNPRAHDFSESLKEGVVLRIFDGQTLFEQATDDLSLDSMLKNSRTLLKRVHSQSTVAGQQKAYQPPSWRDRLKEDLERDLKDQIPAGASAEKWVHFGTSMVEPIWEDDKAAMDFTVRTYEQFKTLSEALPKSDPAAEPDMLMVALGLEKLEFLFIDESVRMSQSLNRNRKVMVALKKGQRGFYHTGGLGGVETIRSREEDQQEVFQSLRKILTAEKLKTGRYKLLMHPSVTGVFAHEAFGHTQEGDTWARGRSKARELYESKTKVGNEYATILNNPAIYKNATDDFAAWGSYYFDEEGWLAQKHFLVKEGYLQSPMTNLTSSVRLGVKRTANGKREAWTNGIYTRQTNTYFAAGKETLNELLAKVDYGFLATTPYGGMEDPKGMGIQVGIQYLEEIKDGKLTGKIFKGPAGGSIQMTGYVPDYLNSILGCSKIEALTDEDDGVDHPWNEVGGCGKYHKELVAAGCGGPYLLVDNVLLG